MRPAHLYVYSDACPSDWLQDGHDTTWHTIVNFVFQSDPALQSLIDNEKPPHEVLRSDKLFTEFLTNLQSKLPSNQLKKWKTGPSYRKKFCEAFSSIFDEFKPFVNAYSFQEETLRVSKQALLNEYNQLIGGIEGRGIGFEEYPDYKNRRRMKYSFINFHGYHEIEGLENQMLPLLFTCYFIANQYVFYYNDTLKKDSLGFDSLKITVVSDKLSGDDELRPKMQENLRHLIDPEGVSNPIKLTRSPESDIYAGDLIADNLAGWLNAAISNPEGEFAKSASDLVSIGGWTGWVELLPSSLNLERKLAVHRLMSKPD